MATYDISEIAEEILALGGTESQILGAHSRVVQWRDRWEAQNRLSQSAVIRLRDDLLAVAARRAKAADTIAQIRSGAVLYTKDATGQWLIWGREDVITPGATVTAARRDGSTQTVVIVDCGAVRERDGLRYRVASFRPAAGVESDPMDDLASPAAITQPQVELIMRLLAQRARSGDGGGFMTGPTTIESVRCMTKSDASAYIDSLTERY